MSLKSKLTRVLLLTFLLAAGGHYVIQRFVMMPGFLRLEEEEAHEDLQRCRFAIDRELALLDVLCQEWAARPADPLAVGADGQRFIDAALSRQTFQAARLNAVFFFNREGQVLRGDVRVDHLPTSVFLPEFSPQRLSPRHPLLAHLAPGSSIKCLMTTAMGPMLVASRPLAPAPGSVVSSGTLVLGRFLDHRAIQALAAQTRVNLRLWASDDPGLDEEGRTALARFTDGSDAVLMPMDDLTLRAYAGYAGLDGAPAVLMRIDMPRTLLGSARSVTRFASLTLLAAGMLHMLILGGLLNRGVVAPLMRLCRSVASISGGEDLSRRLRMRRRDEIGLLAFEFDHLMQRLEGIHDRLHHAAMHDELTGLPNRAWVVERLKVCMERTRRDPTFTFGLLFLDVDKFKGVNDTLGHDAGDDLLRQIAERLRECVRATDAVARSPQGPEDWLAFPPEMRVGAAAPWEHDDIKAPHAASHRHAAGSGEGVNLREGIRAHQTADPGNGAEDPEDGSACVARLGGDEFLIVLEELGSEADARQVAQRVRESLARPFMLGSTTVRSGASVGLVINTPYTTADEMLRAADAAMYRAKSLAKPHAIGPAGAVSNV
ncbi:MAG: diguanylate cyclase [Phycisphaerales bacterium]|nr:diguanylate cyclase [Phycisphaerales bacterium]